METRKPYNYKLFNFTPYEDKLIDRAKADAEAFMEKFTEYGLRKKRKRHDADADADSTEEGIGNVEKGGNNA